MKWLSLVLLLSISCTKNNTEEIRTVSSADIDSERRKAFGSRTIDEVQENSYVHKILTQMVTTPDTPMKQLVEESKLVFVKVKETEQAIELWYTREIIDYSLVGKPTFKFKDVLYFEKSAAQATQLAKKSLNPLYLSESAGASASTNSGSIEFSNLNVKDIQAPLPEGVKKRLGCTDCTVAAKKISYVATVTNETETKKYIAESIISQKVPVFAAELSQCLSTLAGVQTIEVLVKQCQEVYDYQ